MPSSAHDAILTAFRRLVDRYVEEGFAHEGAVQAEPLAGAVHWTEKWFVLRKEMIRLFPEIADGKMPEAAEVELFFALLISSPKAGTFDDPDVPPDSALP